MTRESVRAFVRRKFFEEYQSVEAIAAALRVDRIVVEDKIREIVRLANNQKKTREP